MRRVSILTIFLMFASVWIFGQQTPGSSTPPDQTSSAPQEQQGRERRGMGPGVSGTIATISNDSITLKTFDGQSAQVALSDKTQYRKDRQPAKLTDFKVGDMVFVRGEKSDSGAWQALVVAARSGGGPGGAGGGQFREQLRENMGKKFIAGEVKNIDGTKLTIARPDGVTQTITVDESTSFRKNGESITLADIKPGDQVFGQGELKNDVFVPAVLNVGQPPFMRQGGNRPEGTGAAPPPAPPAEQK